MSDTDEQPDYTFFTDRDLGNIVPRILRDAGLKVEKHSEHFVQDTPDEEWLRKVGQKGWIVLTHDRKIRRTQVEKDALMRAGVRMFVLIGAHTHPVLAENFVNTLSRVHRYLGRNQDPFIARVYKPKHEEFAAGKAGRIEPWLTYEDWLDEQSGENQG